MPDTSQPIKKGGLLGELQCRACGSFAAVAVSMLDVYFSVLCQECRNEFHEYVVELEIMVPRQELEIELEMVMRHTTDVERAKKLHAQIREENERRRLLADSWIKASIMSHSVGQMENTEDESS